MKFKVGDKVRLTRKGIIRHLSFLDTKTEDGLKKMKQLSDGFIVDHCSAELCYCDKEEYRVKEEHLELVPEGPEFEYGEEIEVSCDKIQREKRIFLTKINGNAILPYVCVADYSHDNFINGDVFSTRDRKYARKLKLKLTRKQIAEKFGVSEDFTLVD